jgi:hypothetical protein
MSLLLTHKASFRKFMTGALLVALACAPSLAQAEVTRPSQAVEGMVPHNSSAQPAPMDTSPGSTTDYAAREAAAPELAEFAGGAGGIYIGTGALVVALLVVIVILVVH